MEFELNKRDRSALINEMYEHEGRFELPRDIAPVARGILMTKYEESVRELIEFFKRYMSKELRGEFTAAFEKIREAMSHTGVIIALSEHTHERIIGTALLTSTPNLTNTNFLLFLFMMRAKELEELRMKFEQNLESQKAEYEKEVCRLQKALSALQEELDRLKGKQKEREKETTKLRRRELEKMVQRAEAEFETTRENAAKKNRQISESKHYSLASWARQEKEHLQLELVFFNSQIEQYLRNHGVSKAELRPKNSPSSLFGEECILTAEKELPVRPEKTAGFTRARLSARLRFAVMLAALLGTSAPRDETNPPDEPELATTREDLQSEVAGHLNANPVKVHASQNPLFTLSLLPDDFFESRKDVLLKFTLELLDGTTVVLQEKTAGKQKAFRRDWPMGDPLMEALQSGRFIAEVFLVEPDGKQTLLALSKNVHIVVSSPELGQLLRNADAPMRYTVRDGSR